MQIRNMIEIHNILWYYLHMEYKLLRSKRKTLAIKIAPNSEVIVNSPNKCSLKYIENFLKSKIDWITEKQKEQQTETNKTATKTTSKDKNAKPDGKKETKKETGKTTNKATGQQAENKPGQENKTTKADKDAETTAGSQAQAPAPEINIPGESLEELNARFKENEVISAQALLKMGDSSIIKETFGDPDAFVILYTSKEQQEGSSMKMVQEDPATANTGGSASKSEQS